MECLDPVCAAASRWDVPSLGTGFIVLILIGVVSELFPIVHEDDEILVVDKPAGLVCHPTKDGPMSSLIARARLYLSATPSLVNRLDRETSGIVIVAKNAAVAGEIGKIWESRNVEKQNLAIVHGHVRDQQGVIDQPLGKDESSLVAIKDCIRPDGAPAITGYRVERRFQRPEGDFTLVSAAPRTGRKHQIRIHLAHLGHPIVGDKLYGGDERLYLDFVKERLTVDQWRQLILPNQALHAREVRFTWRGRTTIFSAEPGRSFTDFAGAP